MDKVGIITALTAGILSFISPCVLPLVPAYIAYITDLSIEEVKNESERKKNRIKIIIKCLLFITGFTIIFVLLGASASYLGQFLSDKYNLFSKIAGIFIIIFGVHSIGIIKFKWMYREKRFYLNNESLGFFTPLIMGMAFAFGWTPCIGPILAAILTYASTQEHFYQGVILLTIYSLGLGIPFFLTGIMLNNFMSIFDKIKKYFRTIEIISGTFLIIVGILIFTDSFKYLSKYFDFGLNI